MIARHHDWYVLIVFIVAVIAFVSLFTMLVIDWQQARRRGRKGLISS